MRIGAFEILEPVPELQEPHAIGIIRPWIDAGSVGTLALRRLERHFGAQELGRLVKPGTFFDFTRYRPTIRSVEGQREFTIPNSIVNYAHHQQGPDFLFLHLLEPHSFGEDYCDAILEILKRFGVKRYCRIGAMYDTVPHTRPLLITGFSSGGQIEGIPERVRSRRTAYHGPTTIMNLISEGAEKLGIESMTLMGRLPSYVQLDEDYTGTARLLEVLCSLYKLPSDLPDTERGQRQYSELSATVERNPELKALVRELENYYDTHEAEEEPPPLSPEVERFLREIGQQFDNN